MAAHHHVLVLLCEEGGRERGRRRGRDGGGKKGEGEGEGRGRQLCMKTLYYHCTNYTLISHYHT